MKRTTEDLLLTINTAQHQLAKVNRDEWVLDIGFNPIPSRTQVHASLAREQLGQALSFLNSASKLLADKV